MTNTSVRRRVSGAVWAAALVVAVLWPARVAGAVDGAPLDAPLEALLIGLALPALWWLAPTFLRTRSARVFVVLLLTWKVAMYLAFVPHGLCARARASQPLDGVIQTIPIVEPSGVLRSWDLRADWRAAAPECTAVVTRPLASQRDFPAWFLNLTDYLHGKRDVEMSLSGFVTTGAPHVFSVLVGDDMRVEGTMAGQPLGAEGVRLDAGTHQLQLKLHLTGQNWQFAPRLDGESAWNRAVVTLSPPTLVDRWASGFAALITPLLVLSLLAAWMAHAARVLRIPVSVAAATVVFATLAAIVALQPLFVLHRLAGGLGVLALFVPMPTHLRNLRGAFLLVGVPWLVFFAAHFVSQIGTWTAYSADDWLTYQVAGYRIFMHGYWLEGGTAAFDYQPLYRWLTGALHMVFGDASVGEIYWDATCLLIGAMLALYLVKVRAGFYWGVAAMVGTLLTFTLGTPWYFTGRGLSEIAAAGWAFLAIFLMLRARRGALTWLAGATICAILMFYTRLNHLLFAAFLVAFLLPLRASSTPVACTRALRRLPWHRAALYIAGFSTGVVLFMLRTWLYTGVFALFFGTSLRHNDTGLRPWTLFDAEVWTRVAHSIAGLVFMNEPPAPDPRAVLVIVGAMIAIGAVLQVPLARRQSAAVVMATLGAGVGSLFAHTHNYPGRLSIHFVPLAVALTVGVAAVKLSAHRSVVAQ